LEEKDEVVTDLYEQVADLEVHNMRLSDMGTVLKKDQQRGVRKSEHIIQLEEETQALLERLNEKNDVLNEREYEVVGLRHRLESEHEKLSSLRKWKEEQIDSLEQSRLETQRMMSQLDTVLKDKTSEPNARFRQAGHMVKFLLEQKRSASAEERSKKRLRSLRYLHDLWARELGRGGGDDDPDDPDDTDTTELAQASRRGGHTDTVFINMVKDEQQMSKHDLVVELQKSRMSVSKESARTEELQQQVHSLNQTTAGLKLFSAIRHWLFERKLRTITRRLLAAEAESKNLRAGLEKVLGHARSYKRNVKP
jgi:hypothetical protein